MATSNRTLVTALLAMVTGMFAFAMLVMPPLYQLLCDVTGLNGKTGLLEASQAGPSEDVHDMAAEALSPVRVQFLADTDRGMPWDFYPHQNHMQTEIGTRYNIQFKVRNRSSERLIGQAIPSVSPPEAAQYFKKIECFCFQQQVLEAKQSADMQLIFYIDKAIPASIQNITLSYRLYKINDESDNDDIEVSMVVGGTS